MAAGAEEFDLVGLEALKDKGNAMFKSGNFGAAEAFYLEVIDKSELHVATANVLPIFMAALNNLCAALLTLEKFNDVVKYATKAIHYDEANLKAYYRRGMARKGLKQYEAAVGDADRILSIEKGNKQALSLRAAVLEIISQNNSAKKHIAMVEQQQKEVQDKMGEVSLSGGTGSGADASDADSYRVHTDPHASEAAARNRFAPPPSRNAAWTDVGGTGGGDAAGGGYLVAGWKPPQADTDTKEAASLPVQSTEKESPAAVPSAPSIAAASPNTNDAAGGTPVSPTQPAAHPGKEKISAIQESMQLYKQQKQQQQQQKGPLSMAQALLQAKKQQQKQQQAASGGGADEIRNPKVASVFSVLQEEEQKSKECFKERVLSKKGAAAAGAQGSERGSASRKSALTDSSKLHNQPESYRHATTDAWDDLEVEEQCKVQYMSKVLEEKKKTQAKRVQQQIRQQERMVMQQEQRLKGNKGDVSFASMGSGRRDDSSEGESEEDD